MMRTAEQLLYPSELGMNLVQMALVGERVQALHEARACGLVSHVFDRCVYVQFHSTLICIALHELGASSITALLDESVTQLPVSLVAGTPIRFGEHELFINHSPLIGLDAMSVYGTPNLRQSQFKVSAIAQCALLPYMFPQAGLAPLINPAVIATLESQRLIAYVKPAVLSCLSQVRINCATNIGASEYTPFDVESFKSLFGAGPGLTPSGDDFIAGVFCALHVVGRADLAAALWQSCQAIADSATTPISKVLLEQAALGELSEPLVAVLALMLEASQLESDAATEPTGQFERERLAVQLVQQLNAIGHTSGWDWLTGFILCLRNAVVDQHNSPNDQHPENS